MGVPKKIDDKVKSAILEQIAFSSKSLRVICEEEGISYSTLKRELRDNEEFRAQYARAKEEQADHIFEEILEISDDDSDDDTPFTGINHVQRDKLRIDARKWTLSKLLPKKYGDKLELNANVKNETVDLSKLSDEELQQFIELKSKIDGNTEV